MNSPPLISPLFTDLYELTMAAGYFARGIDETATFSLFVRDTPRRNYFVVAGLLDTLAGLEALRFSDSDIAYLRQTDLFKTAFLDHLKKTRFTGNVHAMPEGSIFFPEEPILEITAPLLEAQIVETYLLNTIGFQTLIATKAARCIHAARGRLLIDFSLRRTQAADAGMKVSRSTYIAGFSATSNVLAGKRYGIPISGTMAHSFVGAFTDEGKAFAAYAETFPDHSVFLIDTYDTLEGAENAAKVALEMKRNGHRLLGVRLDSGDMADLSIKVRRILDDAGLADVKIFASSGFDEHKIAQVISKGARIDAFGVGTKMGVSADAPYLDIVYKMVRCGNRDIRKLSPGKKTLAGPKQVYRKFDEKGRYKEDTVASRAERMENARPLLDEVMTGGKPTHSFDSIETIRNRFEGNFSQLPDAYKAISEKVRYPVHVTRYLARLQRDSEKTGRIVS